MNERIHTQGLPASLPAKSSFFTPPRSGLLQRRPFRQTESSAAPPIVHDGLRSPGRPLDPAPRGLMEPRFGHDFSVTSVFSARSVARAPELMTQEIPLPSPIVPQDGQLTPELRQVVSGLDPGQPLSSSAKSVMQGLSKVPLESVRVHDSRESHVTASALGSEAFAVGNHIVLGHPQTSEKPRDWLLAHEVAHTIQQHSQTLGAESRDSEKEADQFADRATTHQALSKVESSPSLSAAPIGLANRVIARTTHDLPGNLLLVLDVDDGDFVGGCVRAVVPHIGAKLIMKGVPRTAGNQIFNIHVGVMTNARGESCIFFYESVSGLCETLCFPTKEEQERSWERIKEWLRDLIEKVLRALAIALLVAIAAILAWLIAEAIAAALAALLILLA